LNTVRSSVGFTNRGRKKTPLAERLLYGVLAAQLCAIVFITVWALMTKPVRDTVQHETQTETFAEVSVSQTQNSVFTGIGRLRAGLAASAGQGHAADGPATAVITIAFPYNSADRPFLEELSFNTRKFRSITTDYFASISQDSPLLTDEAALKHELLSRYNSLLYLGKIETLYFTEFIIVD
jgi:flagellar basal body-associated protein FliL